MSKYDGIADFLNSSGQNEVNFSFEDIERALGEPLPASARSHRAWWANDTTHTQARAWLDAGWEISSLDLSGEKGTFRKS